MPFIRSLRLCCWVTTSFVLFSFRCVLEIWRGWFWVVFVLQAEACRTNTTQNQLRQISNTQRNENKTTDVVTQQHSCKLLMMDILMSETCWAHKKWNKIASDIKLVFHFSTIPMMQGPINITNFCYFSYISPAGSTFCLHLRLCTGHMAHRGSRGIALLFLEHGTRRGWGVSVTPQSLFTLGKDSVPTVKEAGIRSPDSPARSQLLYRLCYPAHALHKPHASI